MYKHVVWFPLAASTQALSPLGLSLDQSNGFEPWMQVRVTQEVFLKYKTWASLQ